MPPIPFADNFLAGSLLTLLMPTILLVSIAVWGVRLLIKSPNDTPASSPAMPSSEVVGSAPQTTAQPTGQPPTGDAPVAERPPPGEPPPTSE